MTIRVLIVDDQPLVRAGLRTILSVEPDLEVVGEAGDGWTAIALAARVAPDVVLMDVRMPELDGLEATRRLQAGSGPCPAVVILTTFQRDDYLFAALKAGASGFLLKDAPPDRLVEAVRVVHSGEALLAPAVTRQVIEACASGPSGFTAPAGWDELTPREAEIFGLLARGVSNPQIAARLVLGEATVKTHVQRVFRKLALRDRAHAVIVAYESGLVRAGDPGVTLDRPDRCDVAFASACTVGAVLEGVFGDKPTVTEQSVAIAMSLGLVIRRGQPGLGLVPSVVGFALLGLTGGEPFLFAIVALMALLYSVAAYSERTPAIVWLIVCEIALLRDVIAQGLYEDLAFVQVFLLPPWFAGRALRDRRRRVADLEALTEELRLEREARARLAAEHERARIAREMHDVLAHTIGVIAIQAGAGERLVERDPPAATQTFRAIRETGGEALAELRRTLGLVRDGADPGLAPQPGLRELQALAERVRTAGLEVELRVAGSEQDLSRGVQLAAYRIAQEAVTNTLRHAKAKWVGISVIADGGKVRIEVRDDGCGGPVVDGGHGLSGMRERAALYDGWVEAGPDDSAGFAVRAELRAGRER